MTGFKKPPRIESEHLVLNLHLEDLTLKEIKVLIDQSIKDYGPDAVVREICHPHDNYQLSVFSLKPETDEQYELRCQHLERDFNRQIEKDKQEFKRLQEKFRRLGLSSQSVEVSAPKSKKSS